MRKSKHQIYTDSLRITGELLEQIEKLSKNCPAEERDMRKIVVLSLKSTQDSLLYLRQITDPDYEKISKIK